MIYIYLTYMMMRQDLVQKWWNWNVIWSSDCKEFVMDMNLSKDKSAMPEKPLHFYMCRINAPINLNAEVFGFRPDINKLQCLDIGYVLHY